jgi:DNA-binding NarL/FixJ family response regulator
MSAGPSPSPGELRRQDEQLEVLVRLAGGVAHSFNNVLAGIRGYAELALEGLEEGPARADVEQILRAAEQGTELARRLLALTREQRLESPRVDLAATVKHAVALLAPLVDGPPHERPAAAAAPRRPVTLRTDTLRLLLVEDHPAVSDSLARRLTSRGWATTTAGTLAEALDAIELEEPQVAILDLGLPDTSGLELIEPLLDRGCAVVVYTGRGEAAALREAVDRGVRGFVTKDAPLEDLVAALDIVAAGGVFIDPSLASHLVALPAGGPKALSPREREVLKGVAAGATTETVATELGISTETVQTHVRRAMEKLGAETRAQAVGIAVRQSLI